MHSSLDDEQFMRAALDAARVAAEAGEVPVGAVVVKDGHVIAIGHNAPISRHDPTAHAEIIAMREAARVLGNYRLEGCELFVTLEPCSMCCGAILHARLARLVFGAADAKTGAAGSVLNLFSQPQLNHHTQVQQGVLGLECAEVLQEFFRSRRSALADEHRRSHPLRSDALRTPDGCFARIPDYPWQPRYVSDLPTLSGLRMHYLDEGPVQGGLTFLCLHGNPAWSYLYRKMIPVFLGAGHRVIAPDMIGFGKSDKPKRVDAHSFSWHRQVLLELIERLDVERVVLVVQDWGGLLGLTLPMASPERYVGLLVMNTLLATGDAPLPTGFEAWAQMCAKKPGFDIARLFARGNPLLSVQECDAYSAPFPDQGHRAATRAFPAMVPRVGDDDGAAVSRASREFWQSQWTGRTMMAIGMQDPVLGAAVMEPLRDVLRIQGEAMRLTDAGHFVQEQGGSAIAHAALHFFDVTHQGYPDARSEPDLRH
jgi:tRNA(adenine34) deaminase